MQQILPIICADIKRIEKTKKQQIHCGARKNYEFC
jgi:hypothetical protein